MAARWGAGEETTTACNVEFFPLDAFNETARLNTGETLEVLSNCLDSSILSFFEDTPHIETKGIDDESEANLLTALTEILDNVDDENLSPFDTLPDSDLLSGQRGKEHSPLRRLLCLSRSPPEKDLHRPISIGKNLPRIQSNTLQRSDGEEEEDGSLTLSPTAYDSSCDNELLDWNNPSLPLPVTFEQEGEDGLSISLGDLVRQMHPYCMTICLDNNEEQMLPEGGILLEVVDQGENGEPILAIPNMDLPMSLPCNNQLPECKDDITAEMEETSEKLEQIIVVDEDVKNIAPAKPSPDVDGKKIKELSNRSDKEIKSSLRKKSKKSTKQSQSEGRVLRSGTVTKTGTQVPRKYEKRSIRQENIQVPTSSLKCPSSTSTKPEKVDKCLAESTRSNAGIVTSVSNQAQIKTSSHVSATSCPTTVESSKQGSKALKEPVLAPEKQVELPAAPPVVEATSSTETLKADLSPTTSQCTPPLCEVLPPAATTVPEPKPKSLSLAEYRQLRQQKKPQPVVTKQVNSTKWPSLPELPKELLPIPCLPDPVFKDPKRPSNQAVKKVVEEEVRPAWNPRGPAAPPTPEALLVPPAYMTASSSKATTVARPQNTPQPSTQCPSETIPLSAEHASAHRAAEREAPQVTESSQSSNSNSYVSSEPSENCQALSEENCRVSEMSRTPSHKFEKLPKVLPQTTTESLNRMTAAPTTPTVPQKTTESHNVAAASITTLNPETADVSSKHMDNDAQPLSTVQRSNSLAAKSNVLESNVKPISKVTHQKIKDQTQQLIESFTSEIGIEAADLTSLLEQFEETQAKEVQCVPEVSGRAAAVGNSSLGLVPENTVVERVRATDLSIAAALTPPATPPHQMWKPLAPVALLGKSRAVEASKLSPSKVIQIEARPLPSLKYRSKPTTASITVDPSLACKDHDYCLPNDTPAEEPGRRWNVKQQTFITIKPINQPTTSPVQSNPPPPESSVPSAINNAVKTKTQDFSVTNNLDHSSVLETPDASPAQRDTESTSREESTKTEEFKRVYRRHSASRTPSPEIKRKGRSTGRTRKRSYSRSPRSSSSDSDSHSSRSRSRSCAPSKKRYRRRHSQSSSGSSSCSSSRSSSPESCSPPRRRRYSYSSSRSGSWSRSRSRSHSPRPPKQWRTSVWNSPPCRPDYGYDAKTMDHVKRRKEKAIEERRVVYVGRIRGSMTQKELRERFSLYGEIEECTLHFRDHGDNYGFVTYYDTKDAFTAIENGSKLRKPNELPFDLCFGGRRQFCKSNYADLDSSREYEPLPTKGKFHALDFDTLLKQAQQSQKR